MGKYVTKAKLKQMLGDKYDILETNAIDYGSAFVSGKITNVFNDVDNGLHISSLAAVTSSGLSIITNSKLETEMITSISSAFTTNIVQQVSETTSNLLTNKIVGLIPTTSEMTSYINYYYHQNLKSVSDILKEECIGTENIGDDNITAQQKNVQKTSINKLKTNISQIENKAKTVNDSITDVGGKIIQYVGAGPEWVANQLDNITANSVKKVYDIINEGAKPIQKKREHIIKNIAESTGKTLAVKQNNLTRKIIHKQLGTQQEVITKITIKAKIQIQKAKIKVLALIGMH